MLDRSAPFALALVLVAPVAAASPSARLVYARGSGAESCPSEGDLRAAVAVRLGYDPFFPAAPKTVVAQVARAERGYIGKVQIVAEGGNVRGERDLSAKGEDCSELLSAMALAISIAIDDLDEPAPVGATPAEPAPAPAPPSPPPPAPPPLAPPPVAAPAPTAPRAVGFTASAGPTLSFGTAPAPAVGGSVAAAIRYGSALLRLDVRADLPAGAQVAPAGRVDTSLVAATASGCFAPAVLHLCLGGGAGYVSSRTSEISNPSTDGAPMALLVGRAALDVAFSRRVFVQPFAEGALNLTPHRILIDRTEVFRFPDVSVTLGVHVGAKIL